MATSIYSNFQTNKGALLLNNKELEYLYESRKAYLKKKLYNSEINLDQYADSLENYRLFLLSIKNEV